MAGGRSSRFGSDKALVALNGKTLLEHAIERLAPQVDEIVINTNSADPLYAKTGHALAPDLTRDFNGPLAGILAGLTWAKERQADFLVTVAVDTPFFPQNLVSTMMAKPIYGIVVAESATVLHPTFALWPVSEQPILENWLANGQSLRVTDFLKARAFATMSFQATGTRDPFFNINRMEDLTRATKP